MMASAPPTAKAANEQRKNTLSPQQERFVAEYLVDLNATAAYKRAGYAATTDASCAVRACALLRLAKVQAKLAEARAKLADHLEITAERADARERRRPRRGVAQDDNSRHSRRDCSRRGEPKQKPK